MEMLLIQVIMRVSLACVTAVLAWIPTSILPLLVIEYKDVPAFAALIGYCDYT